MIYLNEPYDLARQLKYARWRQNLTQSDLCVALSTSQSAMSDWENLDCEPTLGNAMTWAAALGYQFALVKLEDPEEFL